MSARHGAAAVAIVLVLADLLSASHGSGWHAWPGFDLAYGLVGCIAIILVSKAFGKTGVQQPEDFYDDPTGGSPR